MWRIRIILTRIRSQDAKKFVMDPEPDRTLIRIQIQTKKFSLKKKHSHPLFCFFLNFSLNNYRYLFQLGFKKNFKGFLLYPDSRYGFRIQPIFDTDPEKWYGFYGSGSLTPWYLQHNFFIQIRNTPFMTEFIISVNKFKEVKNFLNISSQLYWRYN